MFVKSNNIRVQIKRSYVENKLNLCKAYNRLVFAKFYARATMNTKVEPERLGCDGILFPTKLGQK